MVKFKFSSYINFHVLEKETESLKFMVELKTIGTKILTKVIDIPLIGIVTSIHSQQ